MDEVAEADEEAITLDSDEQWMHPVPGDQGILISSNVRK